MEARAEGRRVGVLAQTRTEAAGLVRRRPWAAALIAVALLLISIVLLSVAVEQTNAEQLVYAVATGAVVGGLGLLIVGALVTDEGGGARVGHRIALAVVVVGGALTWFAAWTEMVLLAPAGLMVAIVGILMLADRSSETIERNPGLWLGLGLIVVYGSLFVVARPSVTQSLVAAVVAIVGLTVAKLAFSPYVRLHGPGGAGPGPERWAERVSGRGQVALVLSLALAIVGGLLVALPLAGWWFTRPLVVAIGATSAIVGLSGVGLAGLTIGRDQRWSAGPDAGPLASWHDRRERWLGVGGVAVVLLGIGAVISYQILDDWPPLAVLMIGLTAGVGLFFVLRGEGVVALVLFGFLLAWVLVDRDAPTPDTPAPDDPTIVVFGDSFSAGQGSDRYLPNTNSTDEKGNGCRRSADSFSVLLGRHFDHAVVNVACNGAWTDEIHEVGQNANKDAVVPGALPQLDNEIVREGDTELVLVTIGGNDVSFADIVAACLLPTDCADEEATLRAQLPFLGDKLQATYEAILAEIPEAPVVVVPYPQYVGLGCQGEGVDLTERQFAARFIHDLNASIRTAVDDVGAERLHYFDGLATAYVGRTLCDAESGANLAHLLPRDGPILARLSPTTWHPGSGHPNALGHRCTAVTLTRWVEEQPGISLSPGPNAEPVSTDGCPGPNTQDPTETEAFEDLLAEGPTEAEIRDRTDPDRRCAKSLTTDDECFDPGGWVEDELDDSLRSVGPGLGALLAGGMLLGLAMVRLRWTPLDFLAPDLPSYPGHNGDRGPGPGSVSSSAPTTPDDRSVAR